MYLTVTDPWFCDVPVPFNWTRKRIRSLPVKVWTGIDGVVKVTSLPYVFEFVGP